MRYKLPHLLVSAALAAASCLHAFSIDGTAPTVTFTNSDPLFAPFKQLFQDTMNAQVARAFNGSIDTARKNLSGFKQQKELAQGFANANVYATNSATLQGFQNYSLFAVAAGLMVGVQAPSTSVSYYSKVGDDIKSKGDLYAGLGAGFSYFNFGLNSKFILPGLYLNAKYGAFKQDIGKFSMDFNVMGIGANYRFLDPKSAMGLVKWNGLSFGTGFYRQSDKLNMKITPDSIATRAHFRQAVLSSAQNPADSVQKATMLDEMGYTAANPDVRVVLTPTFNMGLDVSTYTIPVDAVTAVSLLWGVVNLTAGAGFDFNFGSSKIVLEGNSLAKIDSIPGKVSFTPAHVKVDGSTTDGPSFARLRVMTGLGVGLGPIKLDIPLIYYFSSGVAFGATVAVVW